MFRRRNKNADVDDDLEELEGSEGIDEADDDSDDSDEVDAPEAGEGSPFTAHPDLVVGPATGVPSVTTGPYDSEDLPADDDRERLDFGGLQVWVPEGIDLRIDFGDQGEIVALTFAAPNESGDVDTMQVSAFAAPRTSGIWDEVRFEIGEGIVQHGGRFEAVNGGWGPELLARLATDQPGVFAPARFLGVNGPRWFLRALITGPLAAVGQDHPALDAALRGVVVVRGKDAMAPRDALPLKPPPEIAEQMQAAMAQAQAQAQQDGA